MNWVLIDAEQKLYLRSFGHGDEVRFCNLFGQVWSSLPIADRNRMTTHWGCSDKEGELRLSVHIALENLSRLRHSQAVGDCSNVGRTLEFYARVIDILPDNLVRYVIAHELAHVLQVAQGKSLRPTPH